MNEVIEKAVTNDSFGIIFKDKEQNSYRFVKMFDKEQIQVWELSRKEYDSWLETCKFVHVSKFNTETLKALKVWNNIDPKLQVEIEAGVAEDKKAYEETRIGRRSKFGPNFPKAIKCTTCNKSFKVQASVLMTKLEKIAEKSGNEIDVAGYVANFKCNKCNPIKRGKPSLGLSKKTEIKCTKEGCTNSVSYPFSHIKKVAEKKKMTVEEFISGYVCQSCSPTIGRKSNGKKQENIELKCKCGFSVSYHPSVVKSTADKKSVTVEDYITNYSCRKCIKLAKQSV
jgi:hypothetical protein